MTPDPKKDMQLPNATYRVLFGVSKKMTIQQIADYFKKNKGTISKKVKQLTRERLIISPMRSSFKALDLTPAGKRYFNDMQQVLRVLGDATPNPTFPLKYRWHNLQFRIPILRNTPTINSELEAQGFEYGKKRAFSRGWEATIDGVPVFYTPKSFQFFPRPVLAGNLEIAVQKGIWQVAGIYEKLKVIFPNLELAFKTELCRQHIALIGDITIKIPEGFNYKSDTLIIDCSTGEPEIEAINSKYAMEHMRRIVAFLDDLANDELMLKK